MITPEHSKIRIDSFLNDHFTSLEQATRHQGESYQDLIHITKDVALAGGKRLRPHMSMLTYEGYSGRSAEDILPVAAAQEVMHMAMLIHDDIMDGDTVRHGEPNVTARIFDRYQPWIANPVERRRRAEHTALLAGDLLVGEAYGLTDDIEGIDPKVMKRVRNLFRTAMRTVVGGQLHDAEAPFAGTAAVSPYQIAHDKTAHYTFVTPLLIGATLAEAPEVELAKLQEIGEKTGIAYQLRDDILGVFGNPVLTGKSADGDLREGKRTLLAEVFNNAASPRDKAYYEKLQERARRHPRSKVTVTHMRQMLEPAQAIVEREIHRTYDDVRRQIGSLAIDVEYRDSMDALVVRSLERSH